MQKNIISIKGGKARWSGISKAERSAIMKRIRKGKKNAKNTKKISVRNAK